MKEILLPTDFSDISLNAINYAMELFKVDKCIFYLLHTYSPVIFNYDQQTKQGGYLKDVVDTVKKTSMHKLELLKKNLKKKNANTKHKFILISSFNLLTDEIKKLINEYKLDFVIMGTKGATGAKEILFGSNTVQVIKKVKCPVMAIPNDFLFVEPVEVLFPTDYKIDYSENQLHILKIIANIYNSRVHILNVSQGRELAEIEKVNKEKLDKLLIEFNDVYYSINNQEIDLTINEFLESNAIHLLMMIQSKEAFFKNLFIKPLINKIVLNLKIPFLVIPNKM